METQNLQMIVVAAGSGTRMGSAIAKPFLPIAGTPILIHALRAMNRIPEIDSLIVVLSADKLEEGRSLIERAGIRGVKRIVAGGSERQHSVYRGLLASDAEWVMVHDAARPFVKRETVVRLWEAVRKCGSAIPGLPVKDTIKAADSSGSVVSTPDRKSLWAIQTPQAFRRSDLLAAHEEAVAAGYLATDDAALAEAAGLPVRIVEGDVDAFKITTPDDLARAESLLAKRDAESAETNTRGSGMIRVGQGFDVHQLTEGRKCIIGGVDIPFDRGLLGHSDADVLLHAIADAVLGALGRGDIGRHFPDNDPAYKDADSRELLRRVWAFAQSEGYRLGNVDATIIAQAPKMAPHIPAMAETIAGLLEADPRDVNVKATTTERLGFAGRGEGIAAQAVVCLVRDVIS